MSTPPISSNDLSSHAPLLDRLRGRAFLPGVHYATQAGAWMAEAANEIERLRADVQEWLCDKCNTVYPGPPQPGFACVQCPKCKGATAPRQTIERRRAERERDEALEILSIALPGPRPWPTEGVEAKLRIYRNMAIDRKRFPDETRAFHPWVGPGVTYPCGCRSAGLNYEPPWYCSSHNAVIGEIASGEPIVLCATPGPSGFICERPKGHTGRHYDGERRWPAENGNGDV